MGGLLGGGKKNNGPTIASGLQLQSSVYGNPIAIVYGTTRVAPNLIWYGDFVATPVSASKGGKGTVVGGGGKSGGGQYKYQTAVAMALCEGPIRGIGNVYVDKTVTSLSSLGLSLFSGTYPQAPWGFLVEENTPITETHVVNGSAQVNADGCLLFFEDGGVTLNNTTVFRASVTGPASGKYRVNLVGTEAVYTFNAAQASEYIQITTKSSVGGQTKVNDAVIPALAPYTITINTGSQVGFVDGGVVGVGVPFSAVQGSPGSNQYTYAPGGTYTFNASRIGATVTISYYTFTGSEAIGYNGIAYVAASAYQLGESAALPNHNFEVNGAFSNSGAPELIAESDTISSVSYKNAQGLDVGPGQVVPEYAAYFIADGGVTDIAGNPFTRVSSNPGYYQYVLSSATYIFSAVNYGVVVYISYTANVSPDADPSLVIGDLLTNTHYGAAFPSQYVGNLSTYQAYCIASGLLVSMALTQQTMTSQTLQDLGTATNSAWVWSNGTLNLIPYGDSTVSAFGYTYTPSTTPVVSLDDNDFMRNANAIGISSATFNDDPVLMSRKRPADQINSIKLQCLDRANDYNVAVIEVKDQALIEQFKLRQSSTSNATLFCNLAAAKQSAQLQLQRQYIRNIYSFQLDQRFIILDPMDIVSITDSTMGIDDLLVRIIEIQENDDCTLSFQAEEYLQGTGTAAQISYQSSAGFAANYNQDPGNVNNPLIFEPTDSLAGGLAVWIGVSGINTALWGGCDIYLSTDGNSYANIGRVKGAARQGTLMSALAYITASVTGQTIDQTNTLSVDLSESGGQLLSGSLADATNLNTLCYCDGEYLAYESAALAGNQQYALTTLVRGAYDSPISSHAAGAQFARLDNAIFQYPYSAPLIGSTVLLKFVSFNIWGGGAQQLSDLDAFTYIVKGAAYTSPLPDVTGFASAFTGYVAGTTQLIWNTVSDFRTVDYEVRQGSTWNSANLLYRTPLLQGPINGDGTYWISAHFKVPSGGPDVYSSDPVSIIIQGSQITQNVIETFDQVATGWQGTFMNTALTSLGLQLIGSGNILADGDFLNTPDVLFYGGVSSSGTYQIPASQRINVGRVETCQIVLRLGTDVGYSLNSTNVLALGDFLNTSNILGIDLGNNTSFTGQVRLSQDSTTWGPWQNWIPGSYTGIAFDARVLLETEDPSVLAVMSDFTFTVDVPNYIQTGTGIAVASGGQAITFPKVFNGGPNNSPVPNIQVTILAAQQGDDAVITGETAAGFNLQIINGGVGVSRSINFTAQGY